eukprot:gene2963-12970_t
MSVFTIPNDVLDTLQVYQPSLWATLHNASVDDLQHSGKQDPASSSSPVPSNTADIGSNLGSNPIQSSGVTGRIRNQATPECTSIAEGVKESSNSADTACSSSRLGSSLMHYSDVTGQAMSQAIPECTSVVEGVKESSNTADTACSSSSLGSSPIHPSDVTGQARNQATSEFTYVKGVKEPRRESGHTAGTTCSTCSAGGSPLQLADVDSQHEHFRSDWHRFNVRQVALKKMGPISKEEFERMLEHDDERSPEGYKGTESTNAVPDAMNKQPQTFFSYQGSRALAVWTCLLTQDHIKTEEAAKPSQLLSFLKLLSCGPPSTWAVILLRGGHFAAAILRAKRPTSSGKASYSYGSRCGKSSKDASGKVANSAGSQLRRHNESALNNDIQQLLGSKWKAELAAADLIFVHAPSSNARSLFSAKDGGGATNPRVQTPDTPIEAGVAFPSPPRNGRITCTDALPSPPAVTLRPTLAETERVACRLATVTAVTSIEKAVKHTAQQPRVGSQAREDQAQAQAQARKLDPPTIEESTENGVRAQSASAITPTSEEVAANGLKKSGGPVKDTPLHKSSRKGDVASLAQLLESGHDPCSVDGKGRTPYQVACNKVAKRAQLKGHKPRSANIALDQSGVQANPSSSSAFTSEIAAAAAEAAAMASR